VRPWTVPDRDILRRISFQLQRPDWQVHSPAAAPAQDGKWHASNGTTDLAADSLAALLDQLDWIHAT
jgi:hypothetical protein